MNAGDGAAAVFVRFTVGLASSLEEAVLERPMAPGACTGEEESGTDGNRGKRPPAPALREKRYWRVGGGIGRGGATSALRPVFSAPQIRKGIPLRERTMATAAVVAARPPHYPSSSHKRKGESREEDEPAQTRLARNSPSSPRSLGHYLGGRGGGKKA